MLRRLDRLAIVEADRLGDPLAKDATEGQLTSAGLLWHPLIVTVDFRDVVARGLIVDQVSVPLHLINDLAAVLLANILLVSEAHLLETIFFADVRRIGRHARVGRDAATAGLASWLDLLCGAIA